MPAQWKHRRDIAAAIAGSLPAAGRPPEQEGGGVRIGVKWEEQLDRGS